VAIAVVALVVLAPAGSDLARIGAPRVAP
jgi:hypothetical protein